MSFIDVGQCDGVLVQAGGEEYLIDAGRTEEGPNVVDFLRARGVEDLEGIVVSNPDVDHIGGFSDALDAFRVKTVYASGDPKGTLTYDTLLRAVREEGADGAGRGPHGLGWCSGRRIEPKSPSWWGYASAPCWAKSQSLRWR